jgi:hypothetical protein
LDISHSTTERAWLFLYFGTKLLLPQIIIINICLLLRPSESVLISVIYINNKKDNEYYAKFCKFEAHLDKRKD